MSTTTARCHASAPARLRVREIAPGDQVASSPDHAQPDRRTVSHVISAGCGEGIDIWFMDGTSRRVPTWDVFVTAHARRHTTEVTA